MKFSQYVNLDIYNNTDHDIICEKTFTFPQGILPQWDDNSYLICEKADYSLTSVPMFYASKDMEIYKTEAGNPSNIIQTYTVYPKGFYYNISEMIDKMNSITASDIGSFKYNITTEKIEFKSISENPTVKIHFSYELYKLFEGFDYVQFQNTFILENKELEFIPQEFSTTDRFYNRKSIRIFAENLGHQAHIENDNISGFNTSDLLSDQILTSGRDRLFYIPSQYRKIKLQQNSRINSFKLKVYVQYSNGEMFPLKISPGAFFSTLINFSNIE
jgi:hypothetical protein